MCKNFIFLDFKPRSYICMSLVFFLFCGFLFAEEKAPSKDGPNRINSLPHCGLYCVYTIIRTFDGEIEFRDLLKPDYISNYEGSSLDELKQAALDNNFFAECVGGMTINSLKSCDTPIVLHVKSSMESEKYDHYILFLGIENNMAKIFSPPEAMTMIPLNELSFIWDGNVLIVSNKPICFWDFFLPDRVLIVFMIGLALFLIAIMMVRKKFLRHTIAFPVRIVCTVAQCSCILIMAFLIGFVVHFFPENGLLSYKDAVDSIQKINAGAFIPKLTLSKMQNIFERGDTVILDNRLKQDFDAGHIEGAINVPINCSDESYRQAISSLSKDGLIVLYCQSAGCKYAELIAIRLKDDGFKNLSVFKGGWFQWRKANEAQSTKVEGEKNERETTS